MRLKKWCKHIEVMSMSIPIPRIIKGKQYLPTKSKKDYWYCFSTPHIKGNYAIHEPVPKEFNMCPICGTVRPTT